jgi:N-carbamoyl-L-amino-acid hydrolase
MSSAEPHIPKLRINAERLWQSVMDLAEFTEPDRPYTRRVFSELHVKGREWLVGQFEQAGLNVSMDKAANIIGRIEGVTVPDRVIMNGSHIDTVENGGRFDGIAGVLVSLEIARTLREHDIVPRHSFEFVDFLGEEPNDYGLSCVGSRGMTGSLNAVDLERRNPRGETLGEALAGAGGSPDELTKPLRKDGEIMAYVELHIEQGKLLERGRHDVGVVTDIVGIKRFRVTVTGRADHAGNTPMNDRQDALVGSARLVDWINRTARAFDAQGEAYFVGTVGRFEVSPNAANIVPGKVDFTLEIRTSEPPLLDAFMTELDRQCQEITGDAAVTLVHEQLSDTPGARCASSIQDAIRQASDSLGFSSIPIASGAGHDAMYVHTIAPMGMVFIPCRDGRSHCPEEWTEPAQLAAGANVVLHAMLRIDREG